MIDWKYLKSRLDAAHTTEDILAVLYALAILLIDERIEQEKAPDLSTRG